MTHILKDTKIQITIATAVIIILFVIGASIKYGSWQQELSTCYKDLDNKIATIDEKQIAAERAIKELEGRYNDQAISTAKIETRLVSIEALLIEIKTDLKESYR